jgi:hypothetical protein
MAVHVADSTRGGVMLAGGALIHTAGSGGLPIQSSVVKGMAATLSGSGDGRIQCGAQGLVIGAAD